MFHRLRIWLVSLWGRRRDLIRPAWFMGMLVTCVLGLYILNLFRIPPLMFVPVPQAFTPVSPRLVEDHGTFAATFPFSSNKQARVFFDRWISGRWDDDDKPLMWITNTETGINENAIPVSGHRIEIEFDPVPNTSYLVVYVRGAAEDLQCGQAGNLVGGVFRFLRLDGTVDEDPNERSDIPCRYNTLRIEGQDGSVEEYPIGTLTVLPDQTDYSPPYVARGYQPVPVGEAWLQATLYVLAVFMVAFPLLLIGFYATRSRWVFGLICGFVGFLVMALSSLYTDRFTFKMLIWRSGWPLLFTVAPYQVVLIAIAVISKRFRGKISRDQQIGPSQ